MSKKTSTRGKLQPNPQNLKSGRRPKPALSYEEIDFCSCLAQTGGVIRQAARYADIKLATAARWAKRPEIQEQVKVFAEKYKKRTSDRDAERQEERKELAHREIIHRLPRMKSHAFRGDEAAVKLIEIVLRSTGEIQPAKHINQAIAGVQATVDAGQTLYAKRLYLPEWRRRTIETLERGGTQAQP
jgi:hypothetical protein